MPKLVHQSLFPLAYGRIKVLAKGGQVCLSTSPVPVYLKVQKPYHTSKVYRSLPATSLAWISIGIHGPRGSNGSPMRLSLRKTLALTSRSRPTPTFSTPLTMPQHIRPLRRSMRVRVSGIKRTWLTWCGHVQASRGSTSPLCKHHSVLLHC